MSTTPEPPTRSDFIREIVAADVAAEAVNALAACEREVLLVLDATTGQNAVAQADALAFGDAVTGDDRVARSQRSIEPIWKRIGGNCHLTRPITSAYQAAGFKVSGGDKGYMPKSPKPFSWIEWGEARI